MGRKECRTSQDCDPNHLCHKRLCFEAVKLNDGKVCASPFKNIKSAWVCKLAAEALGLGYGGPWNGVNPFPRCFFASDGLDMVYFNPNLDGPIIPEESDKYAGICWVDNRNISLIPAFWIIGIIAISICLLFCFFKLCKIMCSTPNSASHQVHDQGVVDVSAPPPLPANPVYQQQAPMQPGQVVVGQPAYPLQQPAGMVPVIAAAPPPPGCY